MSIVEIILSSAVIVTVINTLMQNKNNKLNYVTKERSEWRKELRNIALEIQKSDWQDINSVLTKLKMNLNSYGNTNDEHGEKIDFFKDQHIWDIIKKIEKESNQESDNSKLVQYKRKLIDYIAFLLKFDWERTKIETNADYSIVIYIAFNLLCMGIFVVHKGINIIELKGISLIVGCFFPSLIIFSLICLEKIKVIRNKNWYKEIDNLLLSCISSIIIFFVIIVITRNDAIICILISLSYFGSLFYSIVSIINERNLFLEYSNNLSRYLDLDLVVVFYNEKFFWNFKVCDYLNKKGIEYNKEKLEPENIDIDLLKSVKNANNRKLLRIVKKAEKKNISFYEYISKFPRKYSYIVRYKCDGDIYITIGNDKKEWNKWFD